MKTTTIRIQRGVSDDGQPLYSLYEVAFEAGAKILDGLRTIQREIDPTLGFRWECRSGICGTCTVMVDGIPRLSCEAVLEPDRTITLAPLPRFPVIKDLLVDASPSLGRLRQLRPYLVTSGSMPPITKAEAERSKQYRRCIECFACVAAVNAMDPNAERSLDPLGIVKLARFKTDPRDQADRQAIAAAHGIAAYTRDELRRATSVCPKHINILSARRELTQRAEKANERANE